MHELTEKRKYKLTEKGEMMILLTSFNYLKYVTNAVSYGSLKIKLNIVIFHSVYWITKMEF